MTYTWSRVQGYECSGRGDRRFSAFSARLGDGRTIEQHYQCDVKGYSPGGTNWKLGKGKPGLRPEVDLWKEYLSLWRLWAMDHERELVELERIVSALHKGVLRDSFATSDVNQAHALSVILNDREAYRMGRAG